MKRALITGVTGQDGSYLAELLLGKGYDVYGLVRRSTRALPAYLDSRIRLVEGDLSDATSLRAAVEESHPDEIYNLAAQSHIVSSYQAPFVTHDVNAVGVQRLLQAVVDVNPRIKFYQAGTSEMFGGITGEAQNEDTSFHPRSPYGVAKVAAHHSVVHYRERFGIHASNGILFNHESPRRGSEFLTRKVTLAIGAIKRGETDYLRLGNLSTFRDWGFAGDYVRAMWLMLQQPAPDDYVVGTGDSRPVMDFVKAAFDYAGLDTGNYVIIDPELYRPTDVHYLRADPTRARRELGWSPTVDFNGLVKMMVDADVATVAK